MYLTSGQQLFIEMLFLFFGIFFIYSAITMDHLFWENVNTKLMVSSFGKKATRIIEYVFGIASLVLVAFMLIKLY